jgi:hypothetical protein
MLSRQELYDRRCVFDLVQVVEQLPSRAAVRLPMSLDPASVAMLLLWTLLRWERTSLLVCLEELGVDMWGLTRGLDLLILERKTRDAVEQPDRPIVTADSLAFRYELQTCTAWWLDRARQEAERLNHCAIGPEHLLLAILVNADPLLAELLNRHGLEYERVKHALLAVLAGYATSSIWPIRVPVRQGPFGAAWDTPAVGVPRRFGVGVLMIMMAMFAVLFAVMRTLSAPPEVSIIIAVLVTGVGLGQVLLYGGKYPRAASIWAGAILFPVEIFALLFHPSIKGGMFDEMIALLVISPLLGAGLGYLAGGLTAGVFLGLEAYEKRKAAQRGQEEGQSPDEEQQETQATEQADAD